MEILEGGLEINLAGPAKFLHPTPKLPKVKVLSPQNFNPTKCAAQITNGKIVIHDNIVATFVQNGVEAVRAQLE